MRNYVFNRAISLYKRLTVVALVICIAFSAAGASANECHQHYTGNDIARSGHILPNAPNIELVEATKNLEAQLAKYPPEDHATAKALADEILQGKTISPERIRWIRRTSAHVALTSAWTLYLAGSILGDAYIITPLKDHGYHMLLTKHYTNFFEGIGFLGAFHQGVCATAAACKGLKVSTQKIIAKVKEKLRGEIIDLKFNYSNKYQARSLALTAILFTGVNAAFEINGYFPVRGMFPENIDWNDFISGQLGLVTYYMIERTLGDRFGYFPKNEVLQK